MYLTGCIEKVMYKYGPTKAKEMDDKTSFHKAGSRTGHRWDTHNIQEAEAGGQGLRPVRATKKIWNHP